MQPAGVQNAEGVVSAAYLVEGDDPEAASDPAYRDWAAFMDRYAPDISKNNSLGVFGYAVANLMVEVLKRCGDDLSRDNLMRQAASLKGLHVPMLPPGIAINTSASDFSPMEQMQMMRFTGGQLGKVRPGPRGLRSRRGQRIVQGDLPLQHRQARSGQPAQRQHRIADDGFVRQHLFADGRRPRLGAERRRQSARAADPGQRVGPGGGRHPAAQGRGRRHRAQGHAGLPRTQGLCQQHPQPVRLCREDVQRGNACPCAAVGAQHERSRWAHRRGRPARWQHLRHRDQRVRASRDQAASALYRAARCARACCAGARSTRSLRWKASRCNGWAR